MTGSNMRKIAIANGEYWYGDYKEPFAQLEGAIPGYPQGVLPKDEKGKLLCAYCLPERTFDNLGNHARRSHGMPAAEYKREVGLLQKSALVSERVRVTSLRSGKKRTTSDLAAMREARREPATKSGNGRNTPEALNKSGRCYAQALAVARSIATSGKPVTFAAMARHGIFQDRVRMYFGSIERLRSMAGSPAPRGVGRRYRPEDLLSALRGLAEDLGRTPAVTDLSRFGLPSQTAYENHFGSWVAACKAAGLDPNLPVPMSGEREVEVLNAYATTGSSTATARIVRANNEKVLEVLHKYGFPFGSGDSHRLRVERKAWAAEMARRVAGWDTRQEAA